jgi:hypothetical protein
MNTSKLKTQKKTFINSKTWDTLHTKNQFGVLKIFATNQEKSAKCDRLPIKAACE